MGLNSDDAHESAHGKDGHGKGGAAEWLNTHLGGFIVPFGKRAEAAMERSMFLIVNSMFLRLGKLYLVVFTPLVFIELVMHFVGSS